MESTEVWNYVVELCVDLVDVYGDIIFKLDTEFGRR